MSDSILTVSLLSFFSFFAVLTPVNYVVVFLSLTGRCTNLEKKALGNKSLLIAFITLIISMFVGEYIFKFLQIDIFAFKIAGGFLLALNGISMIFGQNIEDPSTSAIKQVKDEIAVFPLAIPILAGPGGISTGIILFSSYSGIILKSIVVLSVVANFILLFVSLHLSNLISNRLNQTVLSVLYRLSGILVASLATNIIISGIKESGLFG